jgi:hypothetical protein
MRPSALLLLGLASVFGAGACNTAVELTDGAVLRTDLTTVRGGFEPGQSPQAIQVFLANIGSRPIHVSLCDIGAPNPPTAPLVLEELGANSTWALVSPWVICFNPSAAVDQVVAPGAEVMVGRLAPAPRPGRFRFQLPYAASDGTTKAVVSNAYAVQ